jgi:predicted helicase
MDMKTLNLKSSHKSVKAYYEEISSLAELGVSHEGAVSPAFASLIRHCAAQFNQTLVEKYPLKTGTHTLFVDGALVDTFNLVHGYWEAKDTSDDLDKEIKKKFGSGYPKNNILFQAPNRIVIWQDSQKVFDEDVSKPELLIEGLEVFFGYEAPAFEQWQQAVEEFKLKVRELATGLLGLIEKERHTNTIFIQAFNDFVQLCQETINPNISIQAVEEMLIQHLLTERIFRKVFNNPDFVERNVIAHEIEKVISALTSQYFSRNEFLKPLDRFYVAIETTAATIDDFSQKQSFLNTVYEKFFRGFSVKVADTHGIVYTPQPIVKFMVKSVAYILQKEFGRSLSNEGVHIIDPFVGTGNFILWVMREIQHSKLPYKYASELHCNEVMLLPYYIASMNIEHEYYEATGNYQPFVGICLVDTFDLANVKQLSFFTKDNTARVKRQQDTPIFVIICNPPYNAGQVNENDNNKNRKYKDMDRRVTETYVKDSVATYLADLNDPYVKAFRWASDRIMQNGEGIIALVTNSNFIEGVAFDGMRKHLVSDFDLIYILDLGGNVRKNPKLSGTTHNVFGIQVGVSINFLVKKKSTPPPKQAKICYSRVGEFWRKEQKYDFLSEKDHISNIEWQEIFPDSKYSWLTAGMNKSFESFIPIGTKESKSSKALETKTIFKLFSLGVATNRDSYVYSFNISELQQRATVFTDIYNTAVDRLKRGVELSNLTDVTDRRIKWTRQTKASLSNFQYHDYDDGHIRISLYRPFTKKYLYYDSFWNEEQYQTHRIFPTHDSEADNRAICVPALGSKQVAFLMTNLIPDLNFFAGSTPIQFFPFYIYDEDGSNRQENITDWAIAQFQAHYKDNRISKDDIFNYIYAVLHHPQYREKYSANLKRELPRIPFAPDFRAFAKAGKELANIHANYEGQAEYKLTWIEDIDARVNYRVEKMTLSKDKTQIIYNDFLTIGGIPAETFEYRLGNRSALDWVIDQYQVKTDKRSGITNDPNRLEDPQYVIRLIGKVITVSLETMKIIKSLPELRQKE